MHSARCLSACLLLTMCAYLPAQEETTATAAARQLLIRADFPSGVWNFYSAENNASLAKTWQVRTSTEDSKPILVCTGDPFGYLRTQVNYADFELGLQWRYPADPNGNSGILLFTSEENRLWPDSLQIQLHQPTAGCTFPSGRAKSDNELRNVTSLSRPVGQWNDCLVTSLGGLVSVTVNGKKVGDVTGCDPNTGAVGLQSEGSEIHFREIWIRQIAGTESASESMSHARRGRTFNRSCQFSPHSFGLRWKSKVNELRNFGIRQRPTVAY